MRPSPKNGSQAEVERSPEISGQAALRRQLAALLGRLLARSWLRTRRRPGPTTGESDSGTSAVP